MLYIPYFRTYRLMIKQMIKRKEIRTHLAVERFRQRDNACSWIYNEMVRELYPIFHRRSLRIMALKDEHLGSDFRWFGEREARGVSVRLEDRWLVYIVRPWNNNTLAFMLDTIGVKYSTKLSLFSMQISD